jgi:hypothetical protein
MSTTSIAKFINSTDVPIKVEAFIIGLNGDPKYKSTIVDSNEEKEIISCYREWFLTSHFDDRDENHIDHQNVWKSKNLDKIYSIGKFHDLKCINGKYSWMDTDIFDVIYEDEDNIFKFIYKDNSK